MLVLTLRSLVPYQIEELTGVKRKEEGQNKIAGKQQGIKMDDINDFLKDQSKNTLQYYSEKLKEEGDGLYNTK